MSITQHGTQDNERLGSAWQGVPAPCYPENAPSGATLDLFLNAWLGKFTGGISPAALGNAYADWLGHLALAPSKQQTLLQEAWKKIWRWQQYALLSAQPGTTFEQPCIAPLFLARFALLAMGAIGKADVVQGLLRDAADGLAESA